MAEDQVVLQVRKQSVPFERGDEAHDHHRDADEEQLVGERGLIEQGPRVEPAQFEVLPVELHRHDEAERGQGREDADEQGPELSGRGDEVAVE